MYKIAISYRRNDVPAYAGRIYDRLRRFFAKEEVFFDVESNSLSVDFAEHQDQVFKNCKLLIVIIGTNWNRDQMIMKEDDWVRREIRTVLERRRMGEKVDILPILIKPALMPQPSDLPEDIRDLCTISATSVDHNGFTLTLQPVLDKIQEALLLDELIDTTVKETTGGIGRIHDDLVSVAGLLTRKVKKSPAEIKVLETWLPDGYQMIEHAIRNEIMHQTKLKVLILNPKSKFFEQRAIDRAVIPPKDDSERKKLVKEALRLYQNGKATLQRFARISSNVEVRIYDSLPSMQLFICDDWALIGYFWWGKNSVESYQHEIHGDTAFMKAVNAEFNRRWNAAKKWLNLISGEIEPISAAE